MNKIEIYNRGEVEAVKGIPIVLYGKIEGENLNFSASILSEEASNLVTLLNKRIFSSVISVTFKGKELKCLIKDIQFHPISENIVHMDFHIIKDSQSVIVPVPIEVVNYNQAPFKKEGGVLFLPQRKVNIKCFANEIPDYIICDVSALHKGEKLKTNQNLWGSTHFCREYTLVTILDK